MKKTIKTLTATATLTLAGFLASGQTFADEVKPVEPEQPKEETQATTQAENVVTQDTTKIDKVADEVKATEGGVVEKEEDKTEVVLSKEIAEKLNAEKQKKLDEIAVNTQKKLDEYKEQLRQETDKINELKTASKENNSDVENKKAELEKSGVNVLTNEQNVNSLEEINAVKQENQKAVDSVKQKQAEWKAKVEELKAKTTTEGYTKEVVLQALSMAMANPNATVTSSVSGSEETTTPYIANDNGTSGYGRILDSTRVLKYTGVNEGWSTDIDYTNLTGLTVTTSDGKVRNITKIHRHFDLVEQGKTGAVDVYVLNDPTEGFVVRRNNGLDNTTDRMTFRVTDSYYYTDDNGQEVAFTASDKAPIAMTYSSLNYNRIGWEGAAARGDNAKNVEINGSTVTYHPSDGQSYADAYNDNIGEWDTTTSPNQYKGAILGVFNSGSSFVNEFIQWDGVASPKNGQTYWFALNTRVVAPVVEVPIGDVVLKKTIPNENVIKPKPISMKYSITKYEVIELIPEKAVEKVVDGENVDGSTIQYNEVFFYHLKGGLVPAKRSEALNEYAFVDDYDENGDKYNDKYTVKLVKDVTLKDGTVLKAGTDVTEFTTALTEAGKVTISFKSDFLEKVADSSAFQSDSYLEFTRINYGTFENTYVNKVNGKEFKSNTVKTTTPPQTLEQPKPQQPKPQQPKSELPNTGTQGSGMTILAGVVALIGALGLSKKREQN